MEATREMTAEEKAEAIKFDKQWRVELDEVLQRMKGNNLVRTSRERSLAITKLEECIMWFRHGFESYRTPNLIQTATSQKITS